MTHPCFEIFNILKIFMIIGIAILCRPLMGGDTGGGEDSRKIVEALIGDLKAADIEVRRKAIRALGALGTKARSAVPALLEVVGDRFPGVGPLGVEAIGAIGEIGGEEGAVLPILEKAVQGNDSSARLAAIAALGKYGKAADRTLETILSALDDEGAREAIGEALERIAGNPVPLLIDRLTHQNLYVRRNASMLLARHADSALPFLKKNLESADVKVRRGAAMALRRLGEKARESAPALIAVLRGDQDPETRALAAWAIGDIEPGNRDALPLLATGIGKDSQRLVRLGCSYALSRMGRGAEPALPQLLEALLPAPDSGEMIHAVRDALANIGKAAVPGLIEALRDDHRADGAAIVLGRIGADAAPAVPHLVGILDRSKSGAVRFSAVEALGKIGRDPERAVPALIRALGDGSLRLKALNALGDFGPGAAAAAPAIEALLGSGDPSVETFARQALDRIRRRKS